MKYKIKKKHNVRGGKKKEKGRQPYPRLWKQYTHLDLVGPVGLVVYYCL